MVFSHLADFLESKCSQWQNSFVDKSTIVEGDTDCFLRQSRKFSADYPDTDWINLGLWLQVCLEGMQKKFPTERPCEYY